MYKTLFVFAFILFAFASTQTQKQFLVVAQATNTTLDNQTTTTLPLTTTTDLGNGSTTTITTLITSTSTSAPFTTTTIDPTTTAENTTTTLVSTTASEVTTSTTSNATSATTNLITTSTTVDSSNVATSSSTTPPDQQFTTAVTTIAAGLATNLPFDSFSISFQINISSFPNSTYSTSQEAAAALIVRFTDPNFAPTSSAGYSDVLEAFRMDIATRLGMPAADIGMDSIVVDPNDSTQFQIRFRVAAVQAFKAKGSLSSLVAESNTSNAGWLSNADEALQEVASNFVVGGESMSVGGMFVMAAAADASLSSTTASPQSNNAAASTNPACFVNGDCAGTVMTLVAIVFVIILIALTIWAFFNLRKDTEKGDHQQEHFEKEVESRNVVRDKMKAAGTLPAEPVIDAKKKAKIAAASSSAASAAAAASSSSRGEVTQPVATPLVPLHEQEMRSMTKQQQTVVPQQNQQGGILRTPIISTPQPAPVVPLGQQPQLAAVSSPVLPQGTQMYEDDDLL